MRAVVLVREQPLYRRDAYCDGLRSLGYQLVREIAAPGPGDVLLIWNRYGEGHRIATQFERRGATVIVAENGYLGREWHGGVWYSLSLNWNAGVGDWPIGDPTRAAMLDKDLRPWRAGGQYALVLAQRGIGTQPVAQAPGWHQRAAQQLRAAGHEVVIRDHPGKDQANASLYAQLDGAAFAVTWASGAGLKALLYGVPVYHGLPGWVGAAAAAPFGKRLPDAFRGERGPMLERLAWGMWNVEEIGSGEAFRHLLRRPAQAVQPGSVRRAG